MVNYCSVLNCKNNSAKNRGLSFYLIPKDKFRQLVWLPKMGRGEWILKQPELLHKKRICGEHFSENMISGSRLKKDAFPNIFKNGVGELSTNDKDKAVSSASSEQFDLPTATATNEDFDKNLDSNNISPLNPCMSSSFAEDT